MCACVCCLCSSEVFGALPTWGSKFNTHKTISMLVMYKVDINHLILGVPNHLKNPWLKPLPRLLSAIQQIARQSWFGLSFNSLTVWIYRKRICQKYRTRRWRKFQNRKPIGKVGRCEARMAGRTHWWIERRLECRAEQWHFNLEKWTALNVVCFAPFDFKLSITPQRRTLFRQLNFQKRSGRVVLLTFWLPHVPRVPTA